MCGKQHQSDKNRLVFSGKEAFEVWIRHYLSACRTRGTVVFLDSQMEGHAASRFSYIAADPAASVTVSSGDGAWDKLRAFREEHADWMFGWLSYDLKNETEKLTSENMDSVGMPDLHFFVPGTLLIVDRKTCEIRVLKGELFPDAAMPEKRAMPAMPEKRVAPAAIRLTNLQSRDGWERYRHNVLKIKEYIARGDTYEVNLTHQLSAGFEGDSLDLFEGMRNAGPVPFAVWLSHEGVDVCCASPERFLERTGSRVRSQPIKGTSPRGSDPEDDKKIISEILKKEKNRAENVMIVDLVRHDLGRVAQTGSVRTDALLEVQTFSTVHQLVSTVSAEIAPGISPVEVIRACFPMGSMTGAPKIRTMEIIEELETYRRGLYSGAIGYVTPNDDFDLNVVIRTAIIKQNRLFYSVGGAITADSDPRDEWEESWLKARALGHPHPEVS